MQPVEFPHWPLGETINVPDGNGAEEVGEEVLEGGAGVEVDVGVDVVLGIGGASPQRPYSGWQPTISPQCSGSSPHQPYEEQH
jgi:hypothetical protein